MFYEVEESLVGLTINFEYTPQQPDVFDKGHGNYLPGDPASIKIINVWVGASYGRIDVLNSLSSSQLHQIEMSCIDYVETNAD